MKHYYVKVLGNDTFKEVWRGDAESLQDALAKAISHFQGLTIEQFVHVEVLELK